MKLKTPYESYCMNGLAKGCKYCVRGEKLVLFISGRCSRNCWYCSLSDKRKNKDIIWANERIIKNTKELIEEAKESNATSAGITGGDPFLFMNRTLKYAKTLKNHFGKSFHIHIYLPTRLLTKDKLKQLVKYIDEVRFHPEFLINNDSNIMAKDMSKIILASKFYKKDNIGIELPMIPDKKHEILDFIVKISPYIGFVNLNEFELSETNMKTITKKYSLNEGGYTIKDSIKSGIWLLKELKNKKINTKAHLCTAQLKNNYQFKNRLRLHNILPYGKKAKEGLVKYLVTYEKPKIKGKYYYDKEKKRYILSEDLATKMLKNSKVFLIEEFPTYDRIETEKQEIL
jgi:uncharacterized protein